MKNELVYIGGSCLLAPILACAIALPAYMVTRNALFCIIAGTLIGMGIYVAACCMCRESVAEPERELAEDRSDH